MDSRAGGLRPKGIVRYPVQPAEEAPEASGAWVGPLAGTSLRSPDHMVLAVIGTVVCFLWVFPLSLGLFFLIQYAPGLSKTQNLRGAARGR